MLDVLKRKLAVSILGSALRSLATSKDTQTSIAGILAGAVVAVPGFDLGRLLAGDWMIAAHVAAGLAVALLGIWSTRANRDGHCTLVGILGAALYGCSGQVSDIVTALVIALAGYLTNKPTRQPAAVSP